MKPITGAKSNNSKKSNASRYAFIAAALVGFLFIMSLGKNNNETKGSSGVRASGQSKLPTVDDNLGTSKDSGVGTIHPPKDPDEKVPPPAEDDEYAFDDDGNGEDEDDDDEDDGNINDIKEGMTVEELDGFMEEKVEKAQMDFEYAEEEDIDGEQPMLISKMQSVTDGIRSGLSSIFKDSDGVDDNEIDAIVEEVDEELQKEVMDELHHRADEFVQQQTVQMEDIVDIEMEDPSDEYPADLDDTEDQLLDELKKDIDTAAVSISQAMPQTAEEIEKKILEDHLSKKYGRPVTVSFGSNHQVENIHVSSSHHSSPSSHHSTSHHTTTTSSSSSHHSSSGSSSSHHSSSSPHYPTTTSSHHTSSSSHHTPSSSSSHHSASSSHHNAASVSGSVEDSQSYESVQSGSGSGSEDYNSQSGSFDYNSKSGSRDYSESQQSGSRDYFESQQSGSVDN